MAAGEAGKVVLCLRGIGASSAWFRFVFQGLARAAPIIAPHAPGECLSAPFVQHAPWAEDDADAAVGFLASLGIAGPVHVIGSSFGAMTGAEDGVNPPAIGDAIAAPCLPLPLPPPSSCLPQLPAVPTLAEACFPQIGPRTWFGVLAPAATPLALRTRIATDSRPAIAAPAAVDRHVTPNGYTVHAFAPEALPACSAEALAYTLRLIRVGDMRAR
jgi:pimeloyl-ACP methyl ester carboxylesterase